ncbi:MAG: hypothetical protein ACE15C_11165 [Phycisphaerae bacterium]
MAVALWAAAGDAFAGAPVWPKAIYQTVPEVDRLDPPAGPEAMGLGAWSKAPAVGPLVDKAVAEPAARATEIRMLIRGGALCLLARCRDDKPVSTRPAATGAADIWRGDSLEMLIAQGRDGDYPLLQLQIRADGAFIIQREMTPAAMWGEVNWQMVDASLVSVRAKPDKDGWWAYVELPLDKLGVPRDRFRMNIVRNRPADGTHFAWVDLWGGRMRNVFRMATVSVVKAPTEAPPRIELPSSLSVGANTLKITGWREGFRLLVDDKPAAVDGMGLARAAVQQHGPLAIAIQDAKGAEVAGYECDIRRPLIVEAAEPFAADIKKPVAVNVTLDIAGDAKAALTVEAFQGERNIGQVKAALAAGKHKLEVPHEGSTPGEVRIMATAEVPLGDKTLKLAARHWCIIGQEAPQAVRYRDGIGKLPTQAMLRAAAADAGNAARLTQAGDGWFGRGANAIWAQGATYAMALLYKSEWKENPYCKDERFLASAVAGMEAALDPADYQHWLNEPDNRSLQGFLLTYDLLKDDLPAAQAARWKKMLTAMIASTVEIWIRPSIYKLSRYSDDVGTGTNHWAYHAANVYTAGKVFARKDWIEMGQQAMRSLAAHEQEGQFPERRGVPTPHYGLLTQTALAQYYFQSGDEQVKAPLLRCVENFSRTCLSDGGLMNLHDGRVNGGGPINLLLPFTLTPQGRGLARLCMERQVNPQRPRRTGGEGLFRLAEAALWFTGGDEQPLSKEDEFSFMDGRALAVRRKGFQYGLSAMCLPAIDGLYRLDPQNAIELFHDRAGAILRGNNSQRQPEAGSFCRLGAKGQAGKAVWLPLDGSIQRDGEGGHVVMLEFDGFKVRLWMNVLSEEKARVRVELVEAVGSEPVIYNFFPGGDARRELTISEDKKKLQFGDVSIETSAPVEVERNFRIYNPYSDKFESGAKPIRAHVILDKDRPFLLTVAVSGQEERNAK